MDNDIHDKPTRDAAKAARQSETERALLQIWAEVLNSEAIGIHDDFLGLGGDSLAAMRCINRVGTIFGVELPLDLFLLNSATIAEIEAEVEKVSLDTGHVTAQGGR